MPDITEKPAEEKALTQSFTDQYGEPGVWTHEILDRFKTEWETLQKKYL